ncbi:MAG: hypothetical protein E7413_02375 [Ruminococcaceae bacterium]|nr:hypothetical protein [Oscillospiraceae bacterium]
MQKLSVSSLADALLEWLRDEDHIVLDEFFVQYGLSTKQADALAKKHKKLRDTLEFARDTVYARLIAGALTKRFNHSFVTYLLKTKTEPKEESQEMNLSDKVLRERLITLAESVLSELKESDNHMKERIESNE